MDAQAAVSVIDLFIIVILANLGGGDEVAGIQLVELAVGLFHLVQIFTGKEAAVGEQRLVHGTQLVDAQLAVGDATTTTEAPFARTAEGHGLNDLLQGFVTKHHAVEMAGFIAGEQVAFQLRNEELMIVDAEVRFMLLAGRDTQIALSLDATAIAFTHQLEQHLQAVVQVVAIAILFGG